MSKRIGYIGLGAMGAPMAARLVDAGFTVTSCANRSRAAIEVLIAKGLTEYAGPGEVGANSDILLTCVFDAEQTDLVLRGSDGALAGMAPGGFVIVMSTLDPEYCRELAAEAAKNGITVLDCPVSGLPQGAEAGTLSLMIGGDAADVDKVRWALAPLGTVHHCGPLGAGQITKVCNNALVICTVGLLLEMRALIEANHMDFDSFKSVLNESTGRSFVTEHMQLPTSVPMQHPMALKDISIALETAARSGVEMPVTAVCRSSKLKS